MRVFPKNFFFIKEKKWAKNRKNMNLSLVKGVIIRYVYNIVYDM